MAWRRIPAGKRMEPDGGGGPTGAESGAAGGVWRFHGSFCRHANSSVMPATSSVRHADSSVKGLFPGKQAVEAVWLRVFPPGMPPAAAGTVAGGVSTPR